MKRWFERFDPGFLIAALLPLIGILPSFSADGVIRTADGILHTHRIFAMSTLLAHGNLWPRWVPWFHLGYGYPIFNYYPPGVFYLGGLLGLLGLSIPLAFNIVAAMAWIIGSIGTYGLARRLLPGTGALLAAMLWSYAPSRLFEVWDQGSLPQMMAAALVPWVLWGILIAATKPTRRSLVYIGLPFAGIILCHQPITLIGGLFLGPAALIIPLVNAPRDWRTLFRRWMATLGGMALGVGLAAIFLIPLAAELRYVRASDQASDVIAYLTSNFLQPSEIFAQPPAMDLTDLRFELPTTLGLVGGIFGVLGLMALIYRKKYRWALALSAAMAFALFMMLQASLPVWEFVPLMVQLRFPERFLRVAVVFLALLGGASLWLIPERWRPAGLALALLVVLAGALPMVYPNQAFVTWKNLSPTDEIDMEKTDHIWGTTSYDEFNPLWGKKPGWDTNMPYEEYRTDPLLIQVDIIDRMQQAPDLQVEQLGGATNRVTVTSARPVHFRQFYFPGWTATMDGKPVDVYPEDEVGAITIDVPAGEHIITLTYTGTPEQTIGALVTLISIGLVGVLLYRRKPLSEIAPPLSEVAFNPRLAGIFAGGVVLVALVNTYVISPDTRWFRQQSPPDAPVYMQTPVNMSFGDSFQLQGYTLDQDHIAPGGLLDIELFWRAEKVLDREYRPVVQLVNLPLSAAWGVSEPLIPGGGSTAKGYPLDRFASEIHEIPVFADAPPYIGHISVQMVDVATSEPLKLPDGTDRLILPPLIRIDGSGANLPQHLNVSFQPGVELWCAGIRPNGDSLSVDLGWHVTAVPGTDLNLFVHGLDANGALLEQFDGPPLGAEYPTSLWLPGQNLRGQVTLPANPAMTQLAVGLYPPGGERVQATRDGQPLADNQVVLTLDNLGCGT
ncbi:MAG: 6-pyruvoyl-tetrahydropterin synthase-related protein [Chloroflexota bacterium]